MQNQSDSTVVESNKPLSELTVGDWVLVTVRRKSVRLQITRTTATQIIVKMANYVNQDFERKFYKKDGYEVGSSDSYEQYRVEPFTNIEWERILQARRLNAVSEKFPQVNRFDNDNVNEIYNFLLSKELIRAIEE